MIEKVCAPWPLTLSLGTLAGVTVLVALVSEIFVESVQRRRHVRDHAGVRRIHRRGAGSGAAEMASAFPPARKDRLTLGRHRAGKRLQVALVVAPVLVLLSYFIGPHP